MNAAAFYDGEGKGYEFQVAARTTAGCLIGWKRYNEKRASLMTAQLKRLKIMPNVSNDLLEIVTKGLK